MKTHLDPVFDFLAGNPYRDRVIDSVCGRDREGRAILIGAYTAHRIELTGDFETDKNNAGEYLMWYPEEG